METQATTPEASAEGQTLTKHAVRYGAIMGAITIVLTIVVYIVNYAMMVNMWYGLFIFAFFIGFVIYAGRNYRNQSGGYLSFGKAFQHGYITCLVSGAIASIFSILLYDVIDTDLAQNLTQAAVENTEEMMRNFNTPEDRMEAELDKLREEMPGRFSAIGVVKQFGWGLIIYAVVVLITSLFVRKNVPEVM